MSVSLDEKKDKWTEAIQKDGLKWLHLSDLKGWKGEIVKLYNNHTSHKYRLSKENRQKTDFVDYLPKNSFKSSSTVPIPAMPNVSVRIFATFGERNAGRVGPR